MRRVLGEAHDEHPYIETVPKRGYRFVADVRELEDESAYLIIEKHNWAHIITEEEEADSVLPSGAFLLDTLNRCPNNLPGQLTSLIGRKAELAGIEKERARGMLEDKAFALACEQGRAMTLEQAIALAIM